MQFQSLGAEARLVQLRASPPHVRYVPLSKSSAHPRIRCRAIPPRSPSSDVPDPADSIVAKPPIETQPLVTQFEAERNDDDRETFVTAEGLVEEVEEEDAQVHCKRLCSGACGRCSAAACWAPSHRPAVVSCLAEAAVLRSGEQTAAITALVCPF